MKYKLLIVIGMVLIISALALTFYNIYDNERAQISSSHIKEELVQEVDYASLWKDEYIDLSMLEMPTVEIEGKLYIGILDIPRFNLSLPILNESSEDNYYISPCRYYGSAYQDNMVLAAHNYRSHFGKVRNLKQGDQVIFTDMDGNIFRYKVAGIEILGPNDVEQMINSEFDLSLYTCTYNGRARSTIRCIRIYD